MTPFDADGKLVFITAPGGGALRRSTVRGAGATLLAGVLTLAVQVVGTIVLARLLTPTDFGLVAMVTTFSLLLVNFGFNGFTEAIVQREEVNRALASNLFWINLGCGIALTALFAASGSLLALFYHDAPVQPVALGISLTILTTSVSTVHLALLKRTMRFTGVSVNDVCARLVSVAVSIFLASLGWKYWALVVGAVAVPVSTGIGAILMCRWMPSRPSRVSGTGSTLRFAVHTYGNFAVNYLSRNSDNLLVGWRFDAQALGFYKKAYDLFAVTASQLTSSISVVIVAGLSRVRRDSATYKKYLLDALAVTSFVGMGLGAGLTLTGKDLILILMGPKWGPSGQIFTFFGPGVGIMVLYSTHGWIHLSLGRADRWLRWAVFEFAVTFLLFILGLRWGPVGIATAWSVSFWLLTIPAIWYAGQPISLEIPHVLSVVWRYFGASLAAVAATVLVMAAFPWLAGIPGVSGAILRIAITSMLVVPLYLGAVVLLHGGLKPLYQVAGLLKEMVQSRKRDAGAPSELGDQGSSTGRGGAERESRTDVPLVSILIPAYNAEEWIADTISSALAQTWPHKEIIVVDDGSKDNTLAIARQFESQGVQVITQRNQGASAARNDAFSRSRGEYIQWLDADDLLAPDKITRQMEVVMQGLDKRTLLSSSWGHFKYRAYRTRFIPTSLWCDLPPLEWLQRKMDQNVFMQTATWLVSREVTEAAGPWDIRLLGDDDGEYFCRVLLASNGVRFVPDSKVYYRAFRFDGLSYIGRFPEKIEAHWISMLLHIQYIRSLADTPQVRAACLQYLRDSLIFFYPEQQHILDQANRLAEELGAPLGAPQASWKYSWMVFLFGWAKVKVAQHRIRRARWRIAKEIDRILFCLEGRRKLPPPQQEAPAGKVDDKKPLAVRESQL